MRKPTTDDIGDILSGGFWFVIILSVVAYFGSSFVREAADVGFTNAVQSCTIKGNVSDGGEKIYHLERQEYYKEIKIGPEKGKEVFCTENEAVGSGYRKSNAPSSKEYIKESEQRREGQENICPAGAPRGC